MRGVSCSARVHITCDICQEVCPWNEKFSQSTHKKDFKPRSEIINWGNFENCDIYINATSLGLNVDDQINIDFEKIKPKKLFYDVIYNPEKTNFLLKGEELGNETTNGKMMFICQAQLAFKIWHNILPKIDNETIKLLGGSPSVSLKF